MGAEEWDKKQPAHRIVRHVVPSPEAVGAAKQTHGTQGKYRKAASRRHWGAESAIGVSSPRDFHSHIHATVGLPNMARAAHGY